jgi:twinkle protein
MMDYSQESKEVDSRGPCDDCGSSDGNVLFKDGHTHCFVCEKHKNGDYKMNATTKPIIGDVPDMSHTKVGPLHDRNLTADTLRAYDVRLEIDQGVVSKHYYPYTDGDGNILAYKIRQMPKVMSSKGNIQKATLFGQSKFNGGGKFITLTEGEVDCLSVYQMLGSKYPVVSIKNGAQSAYRDCKRNFEWLNTFDNIMLCFDNDQPGQEAIHAVASLFPKKVHVMNLQRKDAGEYLENKDGKNFVNLWWRATEEGYHPEDILTGEKIWDIMTKEDAFTTFEYPWEGLNHKTYGMRTGEMTVVTAGSGVGKTSFLREVSYHLLNNYDHNIGMIMLEESRRETAKGMVSLALDKPIHLPDMHVTEDEMKAGFDQVWGSERMYLMDTKWGGNSIEYIEDKIAYLVQGCDCKTVFLDHISFMVSDNPSDERKMLDEIAHKLKAQCVALDYNLVTVIHTKRQSGKPLEEGGQASLSDIRGTAGVGQLANMVFGLERDGQNDDPVIANTSKVRVVKNRFCGRTGIATRLLFNEFTGRLTETEAPEEESKDEA